MMALAQISIEWSQWTQPLSERWWAETAGSMLVGLTLGVLGCFVVLRRMALIGDALSHAILPGVVIAFIITRSNVIWGLLLGAALAGLTTAVLINLVSRFSRTKEDSATGIVFTALFALGLILVSNLPRATHFDLQDFVMGDPFAVGSADLMMMAITCPLVLLVIAALYPRLKLVSFDPVVAAAMGVSVTFVHYLIMGMLSITVVVGLRTTGVILVIAMLITPASAAYQLTNRFVTMLVLSGLFGAGSVLAGMSAAFVLNVPAGPAMVIAAAALFLVCVVASPSHGVVFRLWRKRQLGRHIEAEDLLKAMYKATGGAADTAGVGLRSIAGGASLPEARASKLLNRLVNQQLVRSGPDGFVITDAGRDHAEKIVRTHRLWETYLNEQAGLADPQLHLEAERLEHAHELAEELDEKLGKPQRDPHGTEIPRPVSDTR